MTGRSRLSSNGLLLLPLHLEPDANVQVWEKHGVSEQLRWIRGFNSRRDAIGMDDGTESVTRVRSCIQHYAGSDHRYTLNLNDAFVYCARARVAGELDSSGVIRNEPVE